MAPGIDGTAGFLLAGVAGDGVVAFQVPITFELGGQKLEVTTPDFVKQRARGRLRRARVAVERRGDARIYDRLLGCASTGSWPPAARLDRRLRRRGVVRPDGHGTDPCSVGAGRATVENGAIAVGLERRGQGPQAYRGTVSVLERGRHGRLLARETFSLPEGAEAAGVTADAHTRRTTGPSGRGHGPRNPCPCRTRGARGEPVLTARSPASITGRTATVGRIVHSYVLSGRTRALPGARAGGTIAAASGRRGESPSDDGVARLHRASPSAHLGGTGKKEGSTERGLTSIRAGSVPANRARSRLRCAVGAVAASVAPAAGPQGRRAAQRPAPEGRDAGRRRGHPRLPGAVAAVASANSARPGVTKTEIAQKASVSGEKTWLLSYGDTGEAVAAVQPQLEVTNDGIFGPITEGAVKQFQPPRACRRPA